MCLAYDLGQQIDGGWWPYTANLADELTALVAALDNRLGKVTHLDLNWSSTHSPPNLNWRDWRTRPQHIMTVGGREASARLLIVPSTTNNTLAGMVLRRAAGLPVDPRHGEHTMLVTAEEILTAARRQQIPGAHHRPETPEEHQPRAGEKNAQGGSAAGQPMPETRGLTPL